MASLPYKPCNGSHQYVVFTPEDSDVFMSSSTMAKLKKMITHHNVKVKKTHELFYNKYGAVFEGAESQEDNEIYIECHPTGSEGEEHVQVNLDKTIKEPSLNFKNPVVITLIGLLAGLILIIVISIVLNYFRGRTATTSVDAQALSRAAQATSIPM